MLAFIDQDSNQSLIYNMVEIGFNCLNPLIWINLPAWPYFVSARKLPDSRLFEFLKCSSRQFLSG
jgi:hypothetical protein